MQRNLLKKFLVTGLSTAICVGGASIANTVNYGDGSVESVYAATIKDTVFNATGTINSNVSMRKGPGTSYKRLDTLKKGTKVTIVAKSSNGWYKIKYKGGFNYVYSQYVTLTKSNEKVTETKYNATGTVKQLLNVRKSASTSSKKLGTLKKNAKVTIVAKTSNGWYKIKYNNGYAYVLGQYITISNNSNKKVTETKFNATGKAKQAVYARKGAGTSYAKVTTIKKGAKITIVAKTSNGWYKFKFNNGYAYVYSDYITISNSKNPSDVKYPAEGVVNHDVFVRKGASTSYAKLGTLYKNAKVTVLEKTSNGWYKIKFKNGTGYVYSQYVDVKSAK